MDEIEFDPQVHMANADGTPRLTKAGTPMKKRGPAKGSAPSPRRSTPSARARKSHETDYTSGINGIFQMIALPLAFTAPADAAAVGHHAPQIADALNDLAKERPEVAAVLERLLSVGPYGALIGAVLPLGVQLLHNHGVVPESVATTMGATPKRLIMDSLREQAEAAQEDSVAA